MRQGKTEGSKALLNKVSSNSTVGAGVYKGHYVTWKIAFLEWRWKDEALNVSALKEKMDPYLYVEKGKQKNMQAAQTNVTLPACRMFILRTNSLKHCTGPKGNWNFIICPLKLKNLDHFLDEEFSVKINIPIS